MDWIKTSLTVFFNGQFWVALVERRDETGCRLAQHIFGPEPGQAEIRQWVATGYGHLRFVAVSNALHEKPDKKVNPKRAKRRAAREMATPKHCTRAQDMLRIIRERK